MLLANLYVFLRLHVINFMINIETEESEIINWLKQLFKTSQNYVTMDYKELNYHFSFPVSKIQYWFHINFEKKKKNKYIYKCKQFCINFLWFTALALI